MRKEQSYLLRSSGIPRNFSREGGSTNSVEDRVQRERGSGVVAPVMVLLLRSSTLTV
jgi:hypothetical protein